jgi:hypothetical protein
MGFLLYKEFFFFMSNQKKATKPKTLVEKYKDAYNRWYLAGVSWKKFRSTYKAFRKDHVKFNDELDEILRQNNIEIPSRED